jgi:urease accessory protein
VPGTTVAPSALTGMTTGTVTDPMTRARAPQSGLPADALLQLMRLVSPALPVGGFSYSEGLEAAVEAGLVGSEVQALVWLDDQFHLGLARCDLPVVARAHRAWGGADLATLTALNDWLTTTRETFELRQQSGQMGRSMAVWLELRDDPADERIARLKALRPAPTWPLAFALAAVLGGVPQREALLGFAYNWCETMVQAALKAVPLGQSAGQRILSALVTAIPDAIERAVALPDPERQAHTPMLAILSACHETQYSRLFRS